MARKVERHHGVAFHDSQSPAPYVRGIFNEAGLAAGIGGTGVFVYGFMPPSGRIIKEVEFSYKLNGGENAIDMTLFRVAEDGTATAVDSASAATSATPATASFRMSETTTGLRYALQLTMRYTTAVDGSDVWLYWFKIRTKKAP